MRKSNEFDHTFTKKAYCSLVPTIPVNSQDTICKLQGNKFEQVSGLHHQTLVKGAGLGPGGGPTSQVQAKGAGLGRAMYSEIQGIMGNGHMGPSSPEQNDRHV